MQNTDLFNDWFSKDEISSSALYYLENGDYELQKDSVFDNQLKISIAISTYKRSNLLVRLLDSIISQSYDKTKVEIVIVDDYSNDTTSEIIHDYMKSHPDSFIDFSINEHNMGVGQSKKNAYLKCSGDIVIFADDDDYFIDNQYFSLINNIYLNNPDCSMTVAGTITHFEKDDIFELQRINFDSPISNVEYINGFVFTYTKPNSMFTMSLRASCMKKVSFEELSYFNDTPLYLFGLLAEGMVYPINKAVGIYYVNGKNMTGNARLDYILGNLDAKHDIYNRAIQLGIINNPKEWYYNNIGMTASYYLKFNVDVKSDDVQVWEWVKGHYSRFDYLRYVLSVITYRLRRKLPVKLKYIKL